MTRHACLLALVVSLAGCATGQNGVTWEAGESSPEVPAVRLPLPIRLGVRLNASEQSGLHQVVLQALRRSGNFELVQQTFRSTQEERLDYAVELDYEVVAGAKPYNFLICFPGFAVLAPAWAQLRWDLEVTTRVRVLPPRAAPLPTLVRRDAFELAFTDAGYSIACNVGFVGLVFAPAVASPLVTGVIAAVHGDQALDYRPRLYASAAGQAWGDRVARLIAARVEADLATRSAAQPAAGPPPEPPADLPAELPAQPVPPDVPAPASDPRDEPPPVIYGEELKPREATPDRPDPREPWREDEALPPSDDR
ncbi:MAG: hypothetical protein AB7N76_21510 [Planctomycetota bacterium]